MAGAPLHIAPDVARALSAGAPVVALETAVVTHGLPRAPLAHVPPCMRADGAFAHAGWNAAAPANAALAHAVAQVVRAAGAVPATVGMLRGTLLVGMTPAQVDELAAAPSPRKLSARDLGPAAAQQASGGTTVAGTLAACGLAGIRVFATGGIGGVHRAWSTLPDISADLAALSRTPCAVVSAGAKAILDLPATVEALDTLGIPVLGVGTAHFPRFTAPGDAALRTSAQVEDALHAAQACAAHWGFCPQVGALVALPPPAEYALSAPALEAAVQAAERAASLQGVAGQQLTPFLLDHLASSTGGRSVDANIAVLAANARFAAALAQALSKNPAR